MRTPTYIFFFALSVTFAAVMPSAFGLPLSPRDVWSPAITSPSQDDAWIIGSTQTVTWDVDHPPAQITSDRGTLLLGYLDGSDDGEHLDAAHPLADNFDLHAGSVSFTVPSVEERKTYVVVLIGDSGNRSPMFTIRA